MSAIVAAAIAGALLVVSVVFVYECVTAPTLDSWGYLIADPYGRLGPPFKEGDPIPPEHEGRRYA